MSNRAVVNAVFINSARSATVLCGFVLAFLIGVIVWNGMNAMNIQFLLSAARNFGASGGILYQIIGSLLLVVMASVLVLPVAIGTALFKSEYISSPTLFRISNTLIYSLNGIPSVTFGIFGLIFFVNVLGTGISWFVGSIILAIMMLPTIVLTTYQSINSIPSAYREAAYALGLTRWQVIWRVLLPQGIHGAITGLLIALARAIGETAPIMFIATAFSGINLPGALNDPVVTLPTHILALAQQATNPDALQNAWGASLVLLTLVFIFSISALFSRMHLKEISRR
ncbi:phosphate ABC transporter permease PstA [Parvularcula sp. IMCC14364]|uniref:phosphate ABC transporter permease PstA n=1 Tax=Parvularcula sp. IMCC14364 TaxID=3067902 RepID=UPI002740B850|nr:phosphate ABC transporter permease PstA [Parvularcula sp. IMCC14364]